jgi:glyoxylase-like metal-dependent hydrolase (beta-lactamase superfamily II)
MAMTSLTATAQASHLPGLYQIALPTPYPVGDVNVYVAESEEEGLTLIDCGVRGQKSLAALRAGLAELGHQVADVRRLIISHHHTDHLGLAAVIQAEAGAEVWAHPLCAPWLTTAAERLAQEQAYTGEFLRTAGGVDQASLEQLGLFWRALAPDPRPIAVSRLLNEGDTIRLLGRAWQVLHTPGHAGDQLCFYAEPEQVLLSSDHLLGQVSSNPLIESPDTAGGPRPQRLLQYLAQLKRVAALPITIAYAGHGAPITDVQGLVANRLLLHEKRAAKLHSLLDTAGQTLAELTALMFPQVSIGELYLAYSEVLGHLDILAEAGQAVFKTDTGRPLWLKLG